MAVQKKKQKDDKALAPVDDDDNFSELAINDTYNFFIYT